MCSKILEMTEELEDGNLISQTEAFLTFIVLSSWRDSITIPKSCGILSMDWKYPNCTKMLWLCCLETFPRNSTTGDIVNKESWWFENVLTLRIDHFMMIIPAVQAKGLKPEKKIGSCIMQYAENWLLGMEVETERVRKIWPMVRKKELQWSISSDRKAGRRHRTS